MGPKTPVAQSSELFRQPLCEMLNAKHPLMKPAHDVHASRRPCESHALAAPGDTLLVCSWLHLLKGRSLRKTRGGSGRLSREIARNANLLSEAVQLFESAPRCCSQSLHSQ